MKQQFGKIYGGNNPTHGVYTEKSLKGWGDQATAVSHHWSKDKADTAAKKESEIRRETCVVVIYE